MKEKQLYFRRTRTEKYEVAFATPYHAVVSILEPQMSANLESRSKLEILDVKILGRDRYAVAVTLETMLICKICVALFLVSISICTHQYNFIQIK